MTLVLYSTLFAIHDNPRALGVPEVSFDQSRGKAAILQIMENNLCFPYPLLFSAMILQCQSPSREQLFSLMFAPGTGETVHSNVYSRLY